MMTLDRPQGWIRSFTLLSLHMQPCSLLPLSQHASISSACNPSVCLPLLKPPPLSLGHSPASRELLSSLLPHPSCMVPPVDSVPPPHPRSSVTPYLILETVLFCGMWFYRSPSHVNFPALREIKIWRCHCTDRAGGGGYLGVRGDSSPA